MHLRSAFTLVIGANLAACGSGSGPTAAFDSHAPKVDAGESALHGKNDDSSEAEVHAADADADESSPTAKHGGFTHASGSVSPKSQDGAAAPSARTPVALPDPSQIDTLIADDYAKLSPGQQGDARYLSLAAVVASAGPDKLAVAQFGVEKLINSLSRAAKMVKLTRVDAGGEVLRLSLSSIGWNAGTWDRLTKAEASSGHIRQVGAAIVADGDWVVFGGTRPEIYDALIGIPSLEAMNQSRLGVNMSDMGIFFGVSTSIVTFNARVLQRQTIHFPDHDGYYWRSYDWLMAGAASAALNKADPTYAKSRSIPDLIAGEFIWSLPNGMQAYMLSGFGAQHRYDAVAEVARDGRRQDKLVINGESCMTCHANGLNPRKDEVGPRLRANPGKYDAGTLDRLEKLYPPQTELDRVFAADNAQFAAAIAALGYKGLENIEPIGLTIDMFKARTGYQDLRKQRGDTDAVLGR